VARDANRDLVHPVDRGVLAGDGQEQRAQEQRGCEAADQGRP